MKERDPRPQHEPREPPPEDGFFVWLLLLDLFIVEPLLDLLYSCRNLARRHPRRHRRHWRP